MRTIDKRADAGAPLIRNGSIQRMLLWPWVRRPLQRVLVGGYYAGHPPRDRELARAAWCIVRSGYDMLPGVPKYACKGIRVHADADSGYRYVLHEGKRLFFPAAWDDSRIRRAYATLLREQSERSPHRYLTSCFDVTPQTVLFDIGAAEGIVALSVVERVAAVHLFECEEEWQKPLRLTFAPWKDKVRIVRKYVSDPTTRRTSRSTPMSKTLTPRIFY